MSDISGKELVAMLATMAHATNEINTFQALVVFTLNSPQDALLAKKAIIHRNTITRVLAAKIFEAFDGLPRFRETIARKGAVDVAFSN